MTWSLSRLILVETLSSPFWILFVWNLFPFVHFQPICVFGFKVNFLWIIYSQITCLIHSAKFSLDCGLIHLYLKWLLIKRELLSFCYLVSLCLIVLCFFFFFFGLLFSALLSSLVFSWFFFFFFAVSCLILLSFPFVHYAHSQFLFIWECFTFFLTFGGQLFFLINLF